MLTVAKILIAIIAALHLYIAWFEIFAWTTRGPAIFSTLDPALFEPTTAIAANQGLYNAFLAVGLIWSLVIRDIRWQANVATCFLLFVLVAGLFGAATVSTRILFEQSIPALAALVALWLGQRRAA
jgi:putative membrane protein